jgi:uncharacterized protein YndB with AHSA1/START domain
MTSSSRHLSVSVDRPPADVYAFVRDPANLPRWSTGVGSSVVREDGEWFVETPAGRARIRFAPRNAFGVLDHDVLTPEGEEVHVPLRVVADGAGSEVVFTLRPAAGGGEADLERDAALVAADLARLKRVLEARDA